MQATHTCCGERMQDDTACDPKVGVLTIERRALECAIWLLHHHYVDGTSHMWREAIHSTQDRCAPHHHPTLQAEGSKVLRHVAYAARPCMSCRQGYVGMVAVDVIIQGRSKQHIRHQETESGSNAFPSGPGGTLMA
jgi:hypothetical protein